jgi:catechol 2,3-dioxygenase-like lactoylglutathione lyase family enzyme
VLFGPRAGWLRDDPSRGPLDVTRQLILAHMSFSRILTNICADDLAASRDFYVQLLGFTIHYDSDWYVQLRGPHPQDLEFGLIKRTHELVPKEFQTPPSGMYVTFVVPNVDELHGKALAMGARVIQEPRNEFYGQRRFLVLDPAGCLLDICSPWSEEEKRDSGSAGKQAQ